MIMVFELIVMWIFYRVASREYGCEGEERLVLIKRNREICLEGILGRFVLLEKRVWFRV